MQFETMQLERNILSEIDDNLNIYQRKILEKSIDSLIKKNIFVQNYNETIINNYNDDDNDFYSVSKVITSSRSKYTNSISNSQNWIGYITEITDDDFTAILEDKNNPTTNETAKFDIMDVSTGDIEMLKLGALFYWSVGYANIDGQVMKQSLIRFKRSIEILDSNEFDIIVDHAKHLKENINWD